MGNSRSKGASKTSAGDDRKRLHSDVKRRHNFSGDQWVDEKTGLTAQEYENHMRIMGNSLFKDQKYAEALNFYNEIIRFNKCNPIAYTNRANTYMKLLRFEDAAEDCRLALTLDPESVKAHYYLGQCLCGLKHFDVGLLHLGLSLEINAAQGGKYIAEIKSKLKKCDRDRYSALEEATKLEDLKLQDQLAQLILNNKERQVHSSKNSQGKRSIFKRASKKKREILAHKLNESTDTLLLQTNKIFEHVEKHRKRPPIPDYMLCKISLLVMQDPVITPSGITYDRLGIEEHLKRGHFFDPTTRMLLRKEDLVPNLAMKEAIEAFVDQNPWVLLSEDWEDYPNWL